MRRIQMLAGSVTMALATGALAVASGSPDAAASSYTPSNPHNIRIPDNGEPSDPFPSSIQAYGLGTKITDVNVTISGLSHTHGDDLDVELVGPNGTAVPLMSDVCGIVALTKLVLTVDDSAATPFPDNNGCATGSYQPTDAVGNTDTWTVAPTATTLAAFNGIDPNGSWRLYVRDDDGSADGGLISDGWSLTITTKSTPALTIPGPASNDGEGVADPYPYSIQVGGSPRTATDVDVVLPGLTHTAPGTLQVLLVSPSGKAVVLMAGACGRNPFDDVNLVFDDSAEQKLSPNLGTCTSGTRTPTVQDDIAPFPAPAPPGPYATKLSAFRGGPATGTWRLYVVDLRQNDAGYLAGVPTVRARSDTKPPNTKVTKRPKTSARARAKLKFSSSENGSTFQCQIDKRRWRKCHSPLKLKHLRPGRHRVTVRAIDGSGNIDPTPVKVVWRVRPRH
jgi:subtilisin-like proprotein convertase family protein